MPGLAAATGQMPNGTPVATQPSVDPSADAMQATPEEQQLYDELVSRCFLIAFDEKTQKPRASVVKMLKAGGDPKEALGQAAAAIFFRVLGQATEAGQDIPDDVKLHAGKEVFDTMAELATKVGVGDFSDPESPEYQGAFLVAVNALQQMEEQSGMQDPEKTSADFDDLIAADKDGQLAALMGGAA